MTCGTGFKSLRSLHGPPTKAAGSIQVGEAPSFAESGCARSATAVEQIKH
jgi:hypothetical protein